MSFEWKDWRNPQIVLPDEPDPRPALPLRHARVSDIAHHAGVSTATVDRVLNQRAGVRETTRQRVLQAKAAIEAGVARPVAASRQPAPPPGRAVPWRLKVLLPADAGPSTEGLAHAFQAMGERGDVTVECEFMRKLEPAQLARKLRACTGQRVDAVAFQALDDPRVHHAVDDLGAAGLPCLSVASGLEHPGTAGYVGVDNAAAGRTAGYLMGRLTAGAGAVAVISSGPLYRSHNEREMGYRSALRPSAGRLTVVSAFNASDDDAGCAEVVTALLDDHPDLLGVYNVGGGNDGLVRALRNRGVDDELTVVCHNLTPETRDYLLDGAVDIVIHQDMQRAAEETVTALVAHLQSQDHRIAPLRVEVITRENTYSVPVMAQGT